MHEPGDLPGFAGSPHGAGERDVQGSGLLPGAARAGGAAPADLPFAQGLGGGLQRGRGGLFARHPAARGGTFVAALIYATDINPHTLQRAEAGMYPIDRIAGFTMNHRESGARSSLSDYYTAGLWPRDFRQDAARAYRLLGPQPRHRQRLRRGATRLLPQRAHLFQPRACRTARSSCSAIRCAATAFSASARRNRCASPRTTRLSSHSYARRGSIRRRTRRERGPP